MTDNAQDTQVQAPTQAPPQLTEEQQIEAIKTFLFQGCLKHYQEFSGDVNRLPLDANMKRIITEKLDDAWLWVKEAFHVLQIQLPRPPQVEAVESKSQAKRKKAQKSKKR